MTWQDEWRAKVHDWIQRLNALALNWHQLDMQGVTAARDRRKAALRVRDWMYEVIDIYLGGIEALPNKLPAKPREGELGALQLALVGAGVAVTVATVAAWISNEETRVIEAKAKLVEAIGKEAREAKDPSVAKALAGVAERLDPNEKPGIDWKWIAVPLVGLAVAPKVVQLVRAGKPQHVGPTRPRARAA